MHAEAADGSRLAGRIAVEIREHGPMSFARFMELALYDPEAGYYASGPERLGPRGDFFTASDVGSGLGECLARQIVEMDRLLGNPDPFTYLELGSGRGLLARDVRDAVSDREPGLAGRMRFVLADSSAAMRAAAASALPSAEVAEPAALRGSIRGCVVAVELFDALPVRRIRRNGTTLREVFVGLADDGSFVESEGRPSREAVEWAERWGAVPEDGDEGEACPAALEQVDALATILDRGFACIVDYGHAASELYGPGHRRGTVLAYHRHAVSEDLFAQVGEQDLTAHVNFTAIEDRARERGLSVLGRTTQDRFLIALGLLERFDANDEAAWRDPERVRRRLQAMQLIHPDGMGRTFKVLLLSRGVVPAPRLRGLEDPFRR